MYDWNKITRVTRVTRVTGVNRMTRVRYLSSYLEWVSRPLNGKISRHFFTPLFFFCNWILHIWNGFYTSKISLLSPLIIRLLTVLQKCTYTTGRLADIIPTVNNRFGLVCTLLTSFYRQIFSFESVRRGVRSYAQCGCNVLAKFWRLVGCSKRLHW